MQEIFYGVAILLIAAGVLSVIRMQRAQETIRIEFTAFRESFTSFQQNLIDLKRESDGVHAEIRRTSEREDARLREEVLNLGTRLTSEFTRILQELSRLANRMAVHIDAPHWRKEDYDFFRHSTEFQNMVMRDIQNKAMVREKQIDTLIDELKRRGS